MAFHFGPRYSFLVSLDAGNSISYPGSGNIWYDISGRYNANLVSYNGTGSPPIYNSANGGYFMYDGIDSSADSSLPFASYIFSKNEITLESWIYHNNLDTLSGNNPGGVQRYVGTYSSYPDREQCIIRTATYVGIGSIHFYIVTGTNTYNFLTAYDELSVDTWYHIVGTWNGNTLKIYKNGTEVASSYVGNLQMITSAADYYSVGGRGYETISGNIAQARIYNRALTQEEISKNYYQSLARYT